jgi:DNA repair protein RadC
LASNKTPAADPLNVGLAKPAQRALANADIKNLAQLAKKSEAEMAALHGMGPNAIATLKRTLAAEGLSFSRGSGR